MLFLVDALANAKSLFSANFLAFPAVADATLGLLSKMANLALTNPWWLGLRIRLLVRLVSSKTCNFDRTIPSQICNLCCCIAFPPGILGFLLSRSLDSFSTTRFINESERKKKIFNFLRSGFSGYSMCKLNGGKKWKKKKEKKKKRKEKKQKTPDFFLFFWKSRIFYLF